MPPTFITHPNADSMEREFTDIWRHLDLLVGTAAPTGPAVAATPTRPASQAAGQVFQWFAQIVLVRGTTIGSTVYTYPLAEFQAGAIQHLEIGVNIISNGPYPGLLNEKLTVRTDRPFINVQLKGATYDPERDAPANPTRLWYLAQNPTPASDNSTPATMPRYPGYYLPQGGFRPTPILPADLGGTNDYAAYVGVTFVGGLGPTKLFLDYKHDHQLNRCLQMQVWGRYVIFGGVQSLTFRPCPG